MRPSLHLLSVRLLATVCSVGLVAALAPSAAEAIGFVVSRTDLQTFLKAHPEVKVHTVEVMTMAEWLKANPNVDPRNRTTFKLDEVVTVPVPLSPTLWPKCPTNMKSALALIIGLDPKEGIVWQVNGVTAEKLTVPAGKLKPGRKYYWQMGFIMKDGTIQDGGAFQFETEK